MGIHIPWDTKTGNAEAFRTIQGSEAQKAHWTSRQNSMQETGVKPFAECIYKHAANQYHETYLSWKSIIWLQNMLEKKNIPFMFTLAALESACFQNVCRWVTKPGVAGRTDNGHERL